MRAAAILLLLLLAGLPDARAQEAADFLLRLRVSPEGPVTVNQRVRVTLTAMTPVRFVDPPRWPDLAFTAGRAVVLPEADTVPGTERVGGQSYAALQRTYTLFPVSAGTLVLEAIDMTVRVGGSEGQPVTARSRTEAARLTARLPPNVDDVARLVVSPAFRLEVSTEGAGGELRVGQPVTRRVQMVAEDTSAMLLPPALWGEPEGVRVYPDPPALQDSTDRGVLRAERRDSVTYVPQQPGTVELPGFGVSWVDPRSGRLQTPQVPPVRLTVLPAAGTAQEVFAPHPGRWVSVALVLLALGASAWWLARRRARRASSPLARLAAACRRNDAHAAVTALYQWADARLPPGGERRVARLAAITGVPELAVAATALEAQLYGRAADTQWRGAELLTAARCVEWRLRDSSGGVARVAPLPPLNPVAATFTPRLTDPRWAR
ncbi:hypothetical protein E0493_09400 [Roseomonas sp. M0104]|uniref:DUF7939 domain-containing protein n=1 Tax=Teichococcus coralli TaxID=2545983 RepID=A0A845BBU3_9PROT|nr:BatD family protein [Pseudoroseomonas coralli]MXP63564.1 hypothetical protein [Pseudoroseomonas coralli]